MAHATQFLDGDIVALAFLHAVYARYPRARSMTTVALPNLRYLLVSRHIRNSCSEQTPLPRLAAKPRRYQAVLPTLRSWLRPWDRISTYGHWIAKSAPTLT